MILDYTDHLELDVSQEMAHHHSLMALGRLAEGLSWLSREVAAIEREGQAEAAPDNTLIAIVGGILDNKPLGLLSCAFQWYAVSACNYAQLVGFLATQDPAAAKEYVKRVMPRLARYRNKVAAHYALANPSRDNEADLAASVMTQVVYVHGRLCAAALTPVLSSAGQEIRVTKDISWSLTLAHQRLTRRYWPSGLPPHSQALPVGPRATIAINVSWSDILGED